ncbi:MAG TPA: AMP-binding protein [Trueperaceae bacterium]|nr:AMP-binding protein [Trueperaceae bacterium]
MILDIAARRAELTPDRPALWWQGSWLTYAELDDRAERTATALYAAGVRRGDRVAILAHNHVAHIDLMLASAKGGFIYAPLNARLAAPEQRAMADYLRPSLLLHDAEASAKAAATGVARWSLDEHEARLTATTPDLRRVDLGPEDVQMILPTGGTTGLPKGAMLPYRQGFTNAVNTVMSWGLRDDDCVVQATPCYHAAVNAFSTPLFHLGGRVVLQRTFDPAEYLELIAGCGATILFLVPTMFRMLADHPNFAAVDLSAIRWAISGGASCPEPVRAAFASRGVGFRQGYGLTEAGVNCFTITTEQAAVRPGSVGKPIWQARAVVRGPDGAPCAPGEAGELTLAGDHLFAGYFEREEATADVLKDGWLWTGDLATVDEEGFFTIVGRRKEMFVSGGENVFPVEVESAIYDHPAVAECAVLGVPDDRWGEVGLAVVVLRRGSALSEAELKSHLRERVANYKVPKHVRFVEELPKSAAGKVLKHSLVSDLGAAS